MAEIFWLEVSMTVDGELAEARKWEKSGKKPNLAAVSSTRLVKEPLPLLARNMKRRLLRRKRD